MSNTDDDIKKPWTTYEELRKSRQEELDLYHDFFGDIELEEIDNEADINLGLFG